MERQQEEGLGRAELSPAKAPDARARGNAAAWGVFLLAAVLAGGLLGYSALGSAETAPVAGPPVPRGEASETVGWSGRARVGARVLEALLAPLDAGGEAAAPSFRAEHLRSRLGVDEGAPLRLTLRLSTDESAQGGPPASAEPLRFERARLLDGAPGSGQGGRELAGSRSLEGPGSDPLLQLLFRPPDPLGVAARPWTLWGALPVEGQAHLVLERDGEAPPIIVPLEPRAVGARDLSRWFGRVALGASPAPAEVAAAESDDPRDLEIARLKGELEAERERRLEREVEWFEFNRSLASLSWNAPTFPQDARYAPLAAETEGAEDEAVDEEPDPELVRRKERAREIGVALGALLRIEGVRGMDLLEPGLLQEGAIGPVVFRTLDLRGRLTGSLQAERLRLEASRAARTLTLVLEEGSESVGGENTPFAGGIRRIVLPHVDPEDWLREVPELFRADRSAVGDDDGRWHIPGLRRELNRLLGLDAAEGFHRVHALGGVQGANLLELHLEEFDRDGRVRRRFFADRARIRVDDEGVVLELFDGAIVRGEEKVGFRDGMHRIFLPRAPVAEWRRARVPGVSNARGTAAPEAGGAEPVLDEPRKTSGG